MEELWSSQGCGKWEQVVALLWWRVDVRPDTDSRRAWAAQMPGVLAWDSPGGVHYCVLHRAQEARQRVPYEGLVGSESTLGTLAQVLILAQAPSELIGQMRGHDPDS